MGNLALRGTRNPQLQSWGIRYSPTRGSLAHCEYKGIDAGEMSVQASALARAGWEFEYTYRYGISTLTATGPTTGIANIGGITNPVNSIIDKWEVGVDEERPDLFENANFINLFTEIDSLYGVPISQQFAHVIRMVAQGGTPTWGNFVTVMNATQAVDIAGHGLTQPNTTFPITLGSILVAFTATIDLGPFIKYFFDDYCRGATNFVRSKYRVRHTTISPSDYATNVADFDVEKIYTIAQLLSELQSTSLWVLPLPNYLAYKILNYGFPVAVPPNYAYGALKLRGDAITTARSRVEIKTEYLIDTWPKHTYGLAT